MPGPTRNKPLLRDDWPPSSSKSKRTSTYFWSILQESPFHPNWFRGFPNHIKYVSDVGQFGYILRDILGVAFFSPGKRWQIEGIPRIFSGQILTTIIPTWSNRVSPPKVELQLPPIAATQELPAFVKQPGFVDQPHRFWLKLISWFFTKKMCGKEEELARSVA